MKVFKVVKFTDVERWTLEGWEFVMVVTQSLAQTVPCSTPYVPHACNNNGYNPGTQYATRDEVVQVHEALFMLSKDGETVSREGALTAERDAATAAASKLQEKLKVTEHNLQVAKDDGSEYQKRYDQLNLKLGEEQGRIRKLEGDLGKVRVAIGTKAFEEALK